MFGIIEVGFFFGVIFFFIYWILLKFCVCVNGLFYFGVFLVFIFGGLFFGMLFDFDGKVGIYGW